MTARGDPFLTPLCLAAQPVIWQARPASASDCTGGGRTRTDTASESSHTTTKKKKKGRRDTLPVPTRNVGSLKIASGRKQARRCLRMHPPRRHSSGSGQGSVIGTAVRVDRRQHKDTRAGGKYRRQGRRCGRNQRITKVGTER